MEGWYSRLRERVPDGPMVRELIEAVERLPGVDAWSHAQDFENRWTNIIAWGLALWMTRSLSGVQPLQQKIAGDIIGLGSPDPDTFAELSGAGLCVALGAVDGTRISRGKAQTADWRLTWPSGSPVDVEVTTARQKESYTRLQALAQELANVLYGIHQEYDLVVHLADPTVEEERDAVLAAAGTLRCGGTQEALGKWQVRSQEIVGSPQICCPASWTRVHLGGRQTTQGVLSYVVSLRDPRHSVRQPKCGSSSGYRMHRTSTRS